MIARRIVVHGKVQGVGFRQHVFTRAEALNLDGFVRNRKDGTVDVLCVGALDAVEALTEHCRVGSPASQVEKVVVEPAEGRVDKGFRQLPTV